MFVLAFITFIFWLVVWIDATIGMKKVTRLKDVTDYTNSLEQPLVSIIVAARNEEEHIEGSLRSQFEQSYKNIEWIVVNDRSIDRTGEIINSLLNEEPRLKVIHIANLKDGWLGKNHALYEGYKMSKGDHLIFTDADIYYSEDTVSKALHYFQDKNIDHLTLAPNLTSRSFWTNAFVTFFLFGFSYFKRPWKANDQKSKAAIGIGAFNLISRKAYEAIGTHFEIKMRPDDDLMLGLKVKQQGMSQHLVLAQSNLKVEWYHNLKAALNGLEKNTFAGLFYSYFMVIFAISGVFISQVWPFLGILLFDGMTRGMYLLSVIALFLAYQKSANLMAKGAGKFFLVFPITALLFMYSIARATFLTMVRGGIVWRGTFYPLKDLKKNL